MGPSPPHGERAETRQYECAGGRLGVLNYCVLHSDFKGDTENLWGHKYCHLFIYFLSFFFFWFVCSA